MDVESIKKSNYGKTKAETESDMSGGTEHSSIASTNSPDLHRETTIAFEIEELAFSHTPPMVAGTSGCASTVGSAGCPTCVGTAGCLSSKG